MNRLSEQDIAAVRRAADLEQIVSEHVTLQRSGSRLRGLCPFHDERTASFYVNLSPDGGWFHCFGCQEHGDVIDFMIRVEGYTFPLAVTELAQRFGVPVNPVDDEDTDRAARDHRARLVDANEAAAAYFADQLRHAAEAQIARNELHARGLVVPEVLDTLRPGYAPRAGTGLLSHLRTAGFTVDEIIDAGLVTKSDRGTVRDRFRGRLMWPIRNATGRTVGFGARRLHDDDPLEAKYLNSPETAIYRKSEALFGLDVARRAIAATRQVVLVEGYTDVAAMRIAGVPNVVATCGTALTVENLMTLRRLLGADGELTSAFDDDRAGRQAAKALYLAAQDKIRRLCVLPSSGGLDPEEFRRAHGDAALRDLTAHRRPLLEHLIDVAAAEASDETPEGRVVALDVLAPLLAGVSDPILRHQYARRAALQLDVDVRDVTARLPRVARQDHSAEPPQSSRPDALEFRVAHLLAHDREFAVSALLAVKESRLLADQRFSTLLARVEACLEDCSGRPWASLMLDADETLTTSLVSEPLAVPSDRMASYRGEMVARVAEHRLRVANGQLVRSIALATERTDKEAALAALLAQTRRVAS